MVVVVVVQVVVIGERAEELVRPLSVFVVAGVVERGQSQRMGFSLRLRSERKGSKGEPTRLKIAP